jgi:hypothetical protein
MLFSKPITIPFLRNYHSLSTFCQDKAGGGALLLVSKSYATSCSPIEPALPPPPPVTEKEEEDEENQHQQQQQRIRSIALGRHQDG